MNSIDSQFYGVQYGISFHEKTGLEGVTTHKLTPQVTLVYSKVAASSWGISGVYSSVVKGCGTCQNLCTDMFLRFHSIIQKGNSIMAIYEPVKKVVDSASGDIDYVPCLDELNALIGMIFVRMKMGLQTREHAISDKASGVVTYSIDGSPLCFIDARKIVPHITIGHANDLSLEDARKRIDPKKMPLLAMNLSNFTHWFLTGPETLTVPAIARPKLPPAVIRPIPLYPTSVMPPDPYSRRPSYQPPSASFVSCSPQSRTPYNPGYNPHNSAAGVPPGQGRYSGF